MFKRPTVWKMDIMYASISSEKLGVFFLGCFDGSLLGTRQSLIINVKYNCEANLKILYFGTSAYKYSIYDVLARIYVLFRRHLGAGFFEPTRVGIKTFLHWECLGAVSFILSPFN